MGENGFSFLPMYKNNSQNIFYCFTVSFQIKLSFIHNKAVVGFCFGELEVLLNSKLYSDLRFASFCSLTLHILLSNRNNSWIAVYSKNII